MAWQQNLSKSLIALSILTLALCFSCTRNERTLKVAATSTPHAEILEAIKPAMQERGYSLEIIEMDDYQLPNRLLAEKQVDANFFQHLPFLQSQTQYKDKFTILAQVHYEPLGIYSKKMHFLEDLEPGAKIALPCDPSNETRALKLLQQLKLIELKKGSYLTILDICKNAHNFHWVEVDAALLPRILADVDIALIPANFALRAGYNPLKDAIYLEDNSTPYANVLVGRKGEENREELKVLVSLLNSPSLRQFILDKFKGSIIPVF